MWSMKLKVGMTDKHHRYFKLTKVCQSSRWHLTALGDWAWNDPNYMLPPLQKLIPLFYTLLYNRTS